MKTKILTLNVNRYTTTKIFVGCGALRKAGIEKEIASNRVFYLVDDLVYRLHQGLLQHMFQASSNYEVIMITAGETAKSFENFVNLSNHIFSLSPQKSDLFVAVGGGTICDLCSFISQTFHRGMQLLLIPTTLLAQVDAAIGGKNGLNVGFQKNKIGSFYHPVKVVCDLSFLSTLKNEDFRNGIAEIIKIFAVSDSHLLWDLYNNAHTIDKTSPVPLLAKYVRAAISRKIELISLDPFETSTKRLLNFGHTFAHTIEELSEFRLKHGEAVFVGMLIETSVGSLIGVTSKQACKSIFEIINEFYSPKTFNLRMTKKSLLASIQHIRNSRGGSLNLVLIEEIGQGIIYEDISDEYLIKATESVMNTSLDFA